MRATFDGPGFPKQSKSTGGEVSWACDHCLRFNAPKAKKCTNCASPRPTEDQGFTACWTCPSCNYEYNPAGHGYCGRCAAYKPIDPREIQQVQPSAPAYSSRSYFSSDAQDKRETAWKSNLGRPAP